MLLRNVVEYLEATIKAVPCPGKPAFADEKAAIDFYELYEMSRSVGSFLLGLKIYKQPVVVFMEKSAFVPAAFFGVVYGGNYYVPIDSEIPAVRIKLILKTVNPPLIICDEIGAGLVEGWGLPYSTVVFSEIAKTPVDYEGLREVFDLSIDSDPLYVVFTSGSTGVPKGVITSHRSVIDYVEQLSDVLGIGPGTVFGLQSPFYLDACLKEIYPTIKFGATTWVVPKSLFMFPVRLLEFLNDKSVNTICWVASALGLVSGLGALEKVVPDCLTTVAFGSEVIAQKHLNRWRRTLSDARFVHLYGPTEATGMSVFYEVDRDFSDGEPIPIGRPFKNTGVVLLSDDGDVVPVGERGEICIRGACLALGYFGDWEKTESSFVQNPLSAFPDLIYKTGDIGYFGEDGELYFVSRRDHQIKHMGYRIELAEIELAAVGIDGVQMAGAFFDDVKSRIILCYMAEEHVARADVVAGLKADLPRYMVPYAVHKLDALPLTAGGKIDRNALKVLCAN